MTRDLIYKAVCFLVLLKSFNLFAQDYNPFVSSASVSPEPLLTVEEGGSGLISFSTGNLGDDSLTGTGLSITIILSNGVPGNDDPLSALGGDAADLFTWSYGDGEYTGNQRDTIPGGYSGTISISYRVTANSTQDHPENGFRAEIHPGPYQSGNLTGDDATEYYTWTECTNPPAPLIGTITDPTCDTPTGSIIINGLPSEGDWILTRYPGGISTPGRGMSVTLTLDPGTYYFIVTNAAGCPSGPSDEATIGDPPFQPDAPVISSVTQPDCTIPTGTVFLTGLPETDWTLQRWPDYITTSGSTATTTITGLEPGSYMFRVTVQDGCTSPSTDEVTISDHARTPSAPLIGAITQPDCDTPRGSVLLNGLPDGTWTLIRYPDGFSYENRTGNSYTVTDLQAGTYRFTVSVSGCTSDLSQIAEVDQQPETPSAPLISERTQPTCLVATGSILLSGLPSGSWVVRVYPGGSAINGSGNTTLITDLINGTYNFTVSNSNGCTSAESADAVINEQPAINAPVIGTVTQPSCDISTGSVNLGGLPSSGTWTLRINPAGTTRTGTGSSYLVTGLTTGTYTFVVTSSEGCVSPESDEAVIASIPPVPDAPEIGTITQPDCESSTGSVVIAGLPSQGTWTLTRTPGDAEVTASGTSIRIDGLEPGTYFFSVTSFQGCVSESSESVIINLQPEIPSLPVIGTITQPTCDVPAGSIALSGLPSGTWILTRAPGNFSLQGMGNDFLDTDIPSGSYSYTVTNSEGCTSAATRNVLIEDAPEMPPLPEHRINCILGTGFAVITIVSPVGSGYEYRLDDGDYTSYLTFFGVRNGTHTISVRNNDGCITTGEEFTVSCGCVNGPEINLSENDGAACAGIPITVTGNTFSGNATTVTITEDGEGSLSASAVTSSPFSFTYTPAPEDAGNIVTISFITDNPAGDPCVAATATYTLTVNPIPSAPLTGSVIHPTCTSSTGSVSLSGLPPQGNWTLVRNPGQVTSSGTGNAITVTGLESGTYAFSVISMGCTSPSSAEVVINEQPSTPEAPVADEIIQPDCESPSGSVTLTGLPPSGTWILTQYPGSVTTSGAGRSTTLTGLSPGTHNFTVSGITGCTSLPSTNIVINAQPPTPEPPVAGEITSPTCPVPTGSVVLNNLPASGSWTINSIPEGTTVTGTGVSTILGELPSGTYVFNVTNYAGCISANTEAVIIPQIPGAPLVVVNEPASVCVPATIDLTNPSVTEGSTQGLTFTYWLNPAATVPFDTPEEAVTGIYYIRGTNSSLCSDIKPVHVTIATQTMADAGQDQELEYMFSTETSASEPEPGETGSWTVLSGSGLFADISSANTVITSLGIGENTFIWTVDNGVCPSSSDTLRIIVNDLIVPTLITPNEDGRNDVLLLQGIESIAPNELIIFDRRGVIVYRSLDYMNDWNGVDYNGKPLQEDTYFYLLKSGNGRERSGFIVIRR